MQPTDKPQFLAVLNGLAAIKPGVKFTPEGLQMWWESMSSWTIEEFRSAAAQLAKSSEFMPNPYHFEQLRKAARMTAGEAWALVLAYARDGLAYPDDRRVNAAVHAIGGYGAVRMSKTDQTPFLERRFAEHYENISDAEDTREALPHIAGFSRLDAPQSIAKLLGGVQ